MSAKPSQNVDLVLIVAATLALVPIVLLTPFLQAVRIALGLPFVLFFPGYALVAALYPRKDDLEAVERVALSFGLSLAVVPLIGLALNYSPWGIRLNPILAFLSLLIVLGSAGALYRRGRLTSDDAFSVPLNPLLPKRQRLATMSRWFAVGVTLTVIGLSIGIYFAASGGSTERFTEFYVLGPGGKAEGYPRQVVVGRPVSLILGVINHEGETTSYRVEIRIEGELVASMAQVELDDDDTWEGTVTFIPVRAGQSQKVEFLLFKGSANEPYRSLHIWLDVAHLRLVRGWNLISIPVSPANPTPAAVFASIADSLRAAWAYQAGAWLAYFPAAPAAVNNLAAVDETMGLWLEMDAARTLTVQGSLPDNPQIPIAAGWNLVGFPAAKAQPVETGLASLGDGYSAVWGYRDGQWVVYFPGAPPGMNSLDTLLPAEGYWIRATRSGTLTISDSTLPTGFSRDSPPQLRASLPTD